VNAFGLSRWAVALSALLPCSAAAQAPATPATGRIEGSVVLSPALSVRKPRIRLYGDYGPGAIPPPAKPASNEFANVVIYLDSVPGAADTTGRAASLTMKQHDETFVPHVLAVVRGSTVEFPNDDPVFHNVFSLSGARTFDLGRYPKGTSKSVKFDRSGIVQVFCHIHSDMSAVVLVLDNPFFTTPANGHYAIDGVPPGDYRVIAWHERIRPIERRLHVDAGKAVTLDLNIPIPMEPGR
jgi:plastocyanin